MFREYDDPLVKNVQIFSFIVLAWQVLTLEIIFHFSIAPINLIHWLLDHLAPLVLWIVVFLRPDAFARFIREVQGHPTGKSTK